MDSRWAIISFIFWSALTAAARRPGLELDVFAAIFFWDDSELGDNCCVAFCGLEFGAGVA